MRLAVLLVLAAAGVGGQAPEDALTYTVEQVDGRLRRVTPAPERRLAVGDEVAAGATLATGWWSHAELSVAPVATRFVLGPRTRVTLAAARPGVLLEVNEGRVRGVFAPLAEDRGRERLVETPTAVLAVRGTEYGVAVAADGATRVVVFEGTVEVTDRSGTYPPLAVHAGQQTSVRRQGPPAPPTRHQLESGGWDRGAMPDAAPGRPGDQPGDGRRPEAPPGGSQGPGTDAGGRVGGGSHGHGL